MIPRAQLANLCVRVCARCPTFAFPLAVRVSNQTVPARCVKVTSDLCFQSLVCFSSFFYFFIFFFPLFLSERWRLRNFSRGHFLISSRTVEPRTPLSSSSSSSPPLQKKIIPTALTDLNVSSEQRTSKRIPGGNSGREEGADAGGRDESWNPWRSYVHWLQARLSIMHVCMYPERRGTDHIPNACTTATFNRMPQYRAARYACVIHAFYRKHKGAYQVLFIARELYFRKHLTYRRGPRLCSYSFSLSLCLSLPSKVISSQRAS